MKKIAVFISGFGSNLQTIAEFCRKTNLGQVVVVVSNKHGVNGLNIARDFNIPAVVIETKGKKMEDFEQEAEKFLDGVDFILLAGFMRVLTENFTKKWQGKMVNIHPSLLPAFQGANAIEDAFNFGVKVMGCTVHFVEAEIDSGRIILQKAFDVLSGDDLALVKKKMSKVERDCYTEALGLILTTCVKR